MLDATSFLFGTNASFIEGLYAQYLSDPNSVDGTWRAFFEALSEERLRENESRTDAAALGDDDGEAPLF